MARALVLAIVLLGALGPAAAQNGKPSCEAICLKRCAPGNVSYNQSTCSSKCIAVCEASRQGKK